MSMINFQELNLTKEEKARFTLNMVHRLIFHHVFWFKEVEHQFGFEEALNILNDVLTQGEKVHSKRIQKELNIPFSDCLPEFLLNMDDENLYKIMETVSKMWIANDGLWFLSVEHKRDMNDAKRCNDSCWCWFSPIEAWHIKRFLKMDDHPGLKGLEKALKFRMYAFLNIQEIKWVDDNTLEFYMKRCRVQYARKRKGLPDYPCKSAGLVEYRRFAESIDLNIKTQCIGCPPDEHPDDWFCAWRFSI
ncbi:hypothetical protein JCM13304A_11190 [Desulfothermus okinawensis JCM 13304]